MTTVNLFELLQVLFAAAGAGLSAMGWIVARRDNYQNLIEGINGSIGMTARWRIARERSRFRKQILILISGLIVAVWRIHHGSDLVLAIYVTRNLTLVLLSADLMFDSITDRHTRQAITEIVRREKLRHHTADTVVASAMTSAAETLGHIETNTKDTADALKGKP